MVKSSVRAACWSISGILPMISPSCSNIVIFAFYHLSIKFNFLKNILLLFESRYHRNTPPLLLPLPSLLSQRESLFWIWFGIFSKSIKNVHGNDCFVSVDNISFFLHVTDLYKWHVKVTSSCSPPLLYLSMWMHVLYLDCHVACGWFRLDLIKIIIIQVNLKSPLFHFPLKSLW